MQVSDLVILVFPNGPTDGEAKQGAAALYNKYLARTDSRKPQRAWVIQVENTKATGDAKVLQVGTNFNVTSSTTPWPGELSTDNTGVYLIFHGRQSGTPMLFGELGNMDTGTSPKAIYAKSDAQAVALFKFIENMKIKKIRKLCLLACNSDVPQKKTSFLKEFVNNFEKWDKALRPMIVGYDDYITVADKGLNAGSKEQKAGTPTTKEWNAQHKHVYVYKDGKILGGSYKEETLEKAGWSDKQPMETNNGIAAIVPIK
jgi:hypothetical protein